MRQLFEPVSMQRNDKTKRAESWLQPFSLAAFQGGNQSVKSEPTWLALLTEAKYFIFH